MALHEAVKDRLDEIERVLIETQEAGVRIIDKTGPLDNPADRDHCIQYMTAVPMIFGRLSAADYEDDVAADPRIDALREKMDVTENEAYTKDYFDPSKRYIGNAVQVFFEDGSSTERVSVDYPIGHRQRRENCSIRARYQCASPTVAKEAPVDPWRFAVVDFPQAPRESHRPVSQPASMST